MAQLGSQPSLVWFPSSGFSTQSLSLPRGVKCPICVNKVLSSLTILKYINSSFLKWLLQTLYFSSTQFIDYLNLNAYEASLTFNFFLSTLLSVFNYHIHLIPLVLLPIGCICRLYKLSSSVTSNVTCLPSDGSTCPNPLHALADFSPVVFFFFFWARITRYLPRTVT